jgi:Tfp pilus assembly protein PilN
MRAVNLLPEDTSARRIGLPGIIPVAGAGAALLAVGAVVALAHVESGKVSDKQSRLDSLTQQLAGAQTPTSSASTAGATLLTSRDSRVAALTSALTGRVPWDVVMRQVAAVLPGDTWLDNLSMTAPTAAVAVGAPAAAPADGSTPAATATGVTITGYTASPASLARVLQRLSVVPSLTDVKLSSSQITAPTDGVKQSFQFTINANIATPGGGS